MLSDRLRSPAVSTHLFAAIDARIAPLFCLLLLTAACVLASLTFACATPFAAFAALAGAMLPLSAALPVVLAAWIVNQAIGFGVLGYPMEMNTLLWGLAIGVAALAATAVSARVPRLLPARGPRCDAHARGDRRLRCVRNRVACFRPGLGRLRGLDDDDHRAAWAVKCPLDAGLGRGLRNRSAADCGNTAPSHLGAFHGLMESGGIPLGDGL